MHGHACQLGLELEVQRNLAERRVADVERKGIVGNWNLLEPRVEHGRLRVQGLGNAGRQAIELNADEARIQAFGHQADEVAHAHRVFQGQAALETQALGNVPHGAHHRLRCEVRCDGGVAGLVVLLLGQQAAQQLAALLPLVLELSGCRVGEGAGQAAPAHIARQDALLVGSGAATFGLDALERLDGLDVVVELLDLTADAQARVGRNAVVGRRDGRRLDQSGRPASS